jgi:hypothetical protein
MALFNKTALKVLREKLFINGFRSDSSWWATKWSSFTGFVTLHSGTQPTANDVKNNWPSYNWDNPSFLGGLNVSLAETSTSSFTLQTTTSTVANKSGTADWAIFWSGRLDPTTSSNYIVTLTTSSFTSSTPPSNYFFVVPVSDITTTTGVVRINDQNVVAGQISTISEVTLTLGF